MLNIETLVQKCETLYLKYGVKSVSMDDISEELGISKKTLYQFIESKEDLIKKVVRQHLINEFSELEKIQNESENALDEMIKIAQFISITLKRISPKIIFELKKYYFPIWEEVNEKQRIQIFNIILKNIENGIKEGLYRDDLNPNIIARLYVGKALIIIDDEVFPPSEFQTKDVFSQFILHHLRGIVSPKGFSKLMQNLNEDGSFKYDSND